MAYEDEMMTVDTIMLPNEDGTEEEYAILDEFKFEENMYMIVAPVDGDMIDDSTTELFRFREEGEDIILDAIEDEAEFKRVADYYASLPEEDGDCECGEGCGCGCGCHCE